MKWLLLYEHFPSEPDYLITVPGDLAVPSADTHLSESLYESLAGLGSTWPVEYQQRGSRMWRGPDSSLLFPASREGALQAQSRAL